MKYELYHNEQLSIENTVQLSTSSLRHTKWWHHHCNNTKNDDERRQVVAQGYLIDYTAIVMMHINLLVCSV